MPRPDDMTEIYRTLSLPDRLRSDADEWDRSECPMRAATSRQAAYEIQRLQVESTMHPAAGDFAILPGEWCEALWPDVADHEAEQFDFCCARPKDHDGPHKILVNEPCSSCGGRAQHTDDCPDIGSTADTENEYLTWETD